MHSHTYIWASSPRQLWRPELGARHGDVGRFLGVSGAQWRAQWTRCVTLQYFSDFSGPVFKGHVSNPDAIAAFSPPQHPGPGAPFFVPQGLQPGTKHLIQSRGAIYGVPVYLIY